uniref:(northern house mosquito) hypothetical protein n=1 Tax=Culex pipiens TaxID=7175 RepID=A0A8D8EA11_CULPI
MISQYLIRQLRYCKMENLPSDRKSDRCFRRIALTQLTSDRHRKRSSNFHQLHQPSWYKLSPHRCPPKLSSLRPWTADAAGANWTRCHFRWHSRATARWTTFRENRPLSHHRDQPRPHTLSPRRDPLPC